MPLPNVSGTESEQDYVSRCMEAQASEDKPEDQKLAICYSTYKEAKKAKEIHANVEKAALDAGVSKDNASFLADAAVTSHMANRRASVVKDLKNNFKTIKSLMRGIQ